MRPITGRQLEVLRFIHEFREAKGYAPSLRDIGARFAIRSTNGVNDHLRALERKGYVTRDPVVSRGVVVTARGRATLGVEGEAASLPGDETGEKAIKLLQRASALLGELAPHSPLRLEIDALLRRSV